MFAKKMCIVALALSQLNSPAMAGGEYCQILENGNLTGEAITFDQNFADGDCEADQNACRWTFPYRSENAHIVAESIHRAIKSCEALVSVTNDTPVNHPDSYQARIYIFPAITIVLSIKDKAALAETFVTLRAAPQN
ncbi:MAG: hypothetical protein ACR2OY_09555 [Boseongicola sp.]